MMASGGRPRVSVVIATWNWSAALRLALESVRRQTFSDFEALIVGDGCTDDSADVVRSVGDERMSWHNLPANTGNQAAPNNAAIARARGELIAYLGHDDVWYPTHLASLVRAMDEKAADVACAVGLLYGPAAPGPIGVTGVFPTGGYAPDLFLPPSTLAHRRSLIDRIGGWVDPRSTALPVDHELVRRAHGAGARIVSTGEPTVFKFPAGWRRDAYRLRDVAPQRAMLERIGAGRDFRLREMARLAAALADGQAHLLRVPDASRFAPGEVFEALARFKGAASAPPRPRLDGPRSVDLGGHWPGLEWHWLERDGAGRAFRWSGPLADSSVDLPAPPDQALDLHVHVLAAVRPDLLGALRLLANGRPLAATCEPSPEGGWTFRATHPGGAPPDSDGGLRLTFRLPETVSPRELGLNEDGRRLGVAVAGIVIEPARSRR